MKTKLLLKRFSRSGYALMMVMFVTVASLLILAGTLNRTYTVSKLNERSNERIIAQNAAEAAVEKVFATMQYDFQSAGGPGAVASYLSNYRNTYPSTADDSFWNAFQFSDGTTPNKTYVCLLSNYTGALPIAYPGRVTANAPVYRIMSNATWLNGSSGVVGTAQEDIMLALVPLTTYAIFYNGLLEFSTCATMTVNGPVHCNTNIYVGAGGTLTFYSTVTSSGTITAPTNNGSSWGNATNFNSSNWKTYFDGNPTNSMGIATVQLALPMTNSHSIIDMPITPDYTTTTGETRLYNQAQVILLVSNTSVTTMIQASPSVGQLPAADGSPYVDTYTNSSSVLSSNLPFLTLLWATNGFYDGREQTTNLTTQIDVGKYSTWLGNNSQIATKFPSGSGYPTILYVADNRTVGAKQLTVVRLTNGIAPPSNGGLGFTLATPNPLYVWGNYNQTNSSYLATSNTSSGTVPCALLSDALTILSSAWNDKNSMTTSYSDGANAWNASSADTVNAAIVTGIVPSINNTSSGFSGGVHNLPRLLEDWSSSALWLNTSIVNLFSSTRATNKFVNPGTYYEPPTRHFAYDLNFSNPNKVPQGIPNALVAIRYDWAAPPPGTTNYNVTP
jgi:hypothetical protein